MIDRITPRFRRYEPLRHAAALMLGMVWVDRKNCWTIAEHRGSAAPDGLVHSVGVQRQCSGTAGRIENSQVAVYLTYAAPRGHALIDRALYLPKSWSEDSPHCADAGIPEDKQGFATKPSLAAELIDHAVARWSRPTLGRNTPRAPGRTDCACTPQPPHRAAARPGRRGRAALAHRGIVPGRQRPGRPRPAPGSALALLAPLDHPDHAAHAFLAVATAIERDTAPTPEGLITLTVNEFRRLFGALLLATNHTVATLLAWSRWRRRHQFRARLSHYRRREQQ